MTNLLRGNITFAQRLVLFFSSFLILQIVSSLLVALLSWIAGGSPKILLISVTLNNLLAFALPAMITAVIVTTNPIKFLEANNTPSLTDVIFMLFIMGCSIPAMDWIVDWNENLTFSGPIFDILRKAEDDAQALTNQFLNPSGIYQLIVTVLVVGIFTGFCEEIFFRGTLLRLLLTKPINPHIAIWTVAAIFSLLHFQFFGFFPRLLLGALFGYLLYWSKSLWLPVIAHAINNSTAVIVGYLNDDVQQTSNNISYAIESFILTAFVIAAYIYIKHKRDKTQTQKL